MEISVGRKEREELLLYEYREKRGREGGKGGREGREGATSARGLSHRGEGGVLVCSALSHKCPGQLGCSAFFKVWDGTTPLGSPPPLLLPPLPLTFHPHSHLPSSSTCLPSLGLSTLYQARCRQAPLEMCSRPWWLWDTLLP